MVGGTNYSVSSNRSPRTKYIEYNESAGSEKLIKAKKTTTTTTTKLVYIQQSGTIVEIEEKSAGGIEVGCGGGSGKVPLPISMPQNQQLHQRERVRSRQIICRCCLSEQQQPTNVPQTFQLNSKNEELDDGEETQRLQFVPLDTFALVNLCDDKYITSSSACLGSDSYTDKNNASAANTAARTTLLDCLNACARIGASLTDNELPQHICLDCCQTLEMCCEFIRCVRNADKILRRRCALPTKRMRQGIQQQLQQKSHKMTNRIPNVGCEVFGKESEELQAAKRRRIRQEKVQQTYRSSDIARAGVNAKSLGYNTPKLISLPKSGSATAISSRTSAERDQLLDISIALNGVESNLVRSFDSGIEVDEDLCSVKSSDYISNENPLRYYIAKHEGYSYVVDETISHDLEHFHRNDRKRQLSSSGGGSDGRIGGTSKAYKCGFCIFECNVRQELTKHLQKHLGPPQHRCRKCNFVGHFKFLLAQHMRNVHHCAPEAIGTTQEVCRNNVNKAAEFPKYHCHLCEEYFVNYDALQQHRKSHKVFCKCTICTFKSSTRENVLEHLAKEHKVLVERRLSVKYIPLQRTNDVQLQNPKPIKNEEETFNSKPKRKNNKNRKHLCQFCGKCFERRFHLLKHEYGVHRNELDETNSSDSVAGNSTIKYTKLKYLRQRNAVQAARQQRCVENLALLEDQKPGEDITSKFQCVICSAVFMFNFELKYHMRTHTVNADRKTIVVGVFNSNSIRNNKELADKRIIKTTLPPSKPLIVESERKLTAVIAEDRTQTQEVIGKACEQGKHIESVANIEGGHVHDDGAIDAIPNGEAITDVYGDVYNNGEPTGDATNIDVVDINANVDVKNANDSLKYITATLTATLTDTVDLDLMSLVPQTSPLDSLDTSPSSSNNSFDINYDDQLYLNDFDLGLLDCDGAFGGFCYE